MKKTALFDTLQAAGATMERIAGWTVATTLGGAPGSSGTFLVDTSHNGRLTIEGIRSDELFGAAELAIGASQSYQQGRLYRLRRDRFLLATPPDMATAIATALTRQENGLGLITVTDVSHGQAELTLIGENAAQTLSRLCSLDLAPGEFPDGEARESSVAKTRQLIIRQEIGGRPTYKLIGSRSLASYLWATILEAGASLNVAAAGLDALTS